MVSDLTGCLQNVIGRAPIEFTPSPQVPTSLEGSEPGASIVFLSQGVGAHCKRTIVHGTQMKGSKAEGMHEIFLGLI